MDQGKIKLHEVAETAVKQRADQLLHNYNVLVEVSYDELAKLGILESYLLLRGQESTNRKTYDYVTLGQAKSLGLIS